MKENLRRTPPTLLKKTMPRFVTVKKAEEEKNLAKKYVTNFLVYRSALMGMISLLVGYGVVIFLIFRDRPVSDLLSYSLILLGAGLAFGLFEAGYAHYLLRRHPSYYGDKMKRMELRMAGKFKKMGDPVGVTHPGRWAVPFVYLAGWVCFFALVYYLRVKLNTISAVFLFLGGFHNARFFYLKRLIKR
ncbi:MAG TPA: hypothetical protein VIU33_04865 [Nitrospiria bacterium]